MPPNTIIPDEDIRAIYTYLKTVPVIQNDVVAMTGK